jgi:hypothetical protein
VKLLGNSKYKLKIIEKILKALLDRLLKKKFKKSVLLWKTIKWLKIITRNRLKNIYYDETVEFIKLNSNMKRKAKK